MKLVRVKVDVAGTSGEQAWIEMRRFEEVEPRGEVFRLFCGHGAGDVHGAGEWGEATLEFEDFIAEYAVAHYTRQERVVDVEVEMVK